jgi:hypothetical protein
LLVGLPLVTGAALIVHIAISIALPLGVGIAFAGALVLAAVTWRRLSFGLRAALRRRALLGIGIGLVSTFAYDATRLLLVWTVSFQFNPLETIRVFGQLLVGPAQPAALVFAAGALYHFANGIGFATALLLFVRRPRVRHGLAWAFMLEVIMVSLYPGWLNLAAIDEFVSVSVVGHVAYGLTLGVLARGLVGTDALSAQPDGAPALRGPE